MVEAAASILQTTELIRNVASVINHSVLNHMHFSHINHSNQIKFKVKNKAKIMQSAV
jgi:hypothetical protein